MKKTEQEVKKLNQEKISNVKLLFNVLVSPGDSFDYIKNNKINIIIPILIILVFLSLTYLLDLYFIITIFHLFIVPLIIYKLIILLGRREIAFKKFYIIYTFTFIPLLILLFISYFIPVDIIKEVFIHMGNLLGNLWRYILLIFAIYRVYEIKRSITFCIIILAGVFSVFIYYILYGLIWRFFL